MKIINLKFCLSLLFSSIILLGCNEDAFLTKENPNAYQASSFYKKEADFNTALNTVYAALQLQSVSGGGLVGEMAQSDLARTFTFAPTNAFTNLTYNDNDSFIVNKWEELYIGINRANQVIVNIQNVADNVFRSEENKLVIEAQAKCLRAFYYFQLVTTFGQGVLHTDLITNVFDTQKALSTRQEIEQQLIIPDLLFAKENLPEVWDGINVGRVTTGTAASLLGKLYLYNEQWTDAAAEFRDVINSGVYSLTPDYFDNFTHYNEYNSESILETNYSFDLVEGANGANVDDNPGGVVGAESTQLSRLVGKNRQGGNAQILTSYIYHEILTNDELADGSGGASPRLNSTIAPFNFEGLYYLVDTPNQLSNPFYNVGITAYVKKYSNWYHQANEIALDRSGINFRHIRYADVLLMCAEALLEGGTTTDQAKIDEAIDYIDIVRARAGIFTIQDYLDDNGNQFPQMHVTRIGQPAGTPLPLVAPTAENLLTHLQLVERPNELGYEGHRWKDLVRWGIVRQALQAAFDHSEIAIAYYRGPNRNTPPLYIRQNLRPDIDQYFSIPLQRYSPSFDYWPLPNTERQNNEGL